MTTPCSALGYGGDPLEATYNQDVTTHVALLGAVAITALVVGAGFSEEPPPTPPPTWPGCRALGAEDKPAVVSRHRTRRSRAASARVLSGTSVILRHEKSISRKQFEISPKRDAVVEALIDLTVEHIDKKMSESVGASHSRVAERRALASDVEIEFYITMVYSIPGRSVLGVSGIHVVPYLDAHARRPKGHRGERDAHELLQVVPHRWRAAVGARTLSRWLLLSCRSGGPRFDPATAHHPLPLLPSPAPQ